MLSFSINTLSTIVLAAELADSSVAYRSSNWWMVGEMIQY